MTRTFEPTTHISRARNWVGLCALVLFPLLSLPGDAKAFCGFYVSGADASLYSNATMVVMMRDGNTTILSMQNNYQGPPEDFALVIPVPVVLSEDDVVTLPREVFARVDSLSAPRLVEYWEGDPCMPATGILEVLRRTTGAWNSPASPYGTSADLGVTVEAEFAVAEYDVVILSAEDSNGLDTWLRAGEYNIPAGAEPVLRPYVERGTKFFVAKVDAERVTFGSDGNAVLSPLRFHYDTEDFSLPVRLGLLNTAGTQDLLVHILARGQRYEVANYENATIPTNTIVDEQTRWAFGDFYDLLFRRTIAHNPNAVVTEYAWDAGFCDPCPVEALSPSEIATLGADVLPGAPFGFVLTRLHYRYGADALGEDLVFREAAPIEGGRGAPSPDGTLEEKAAATGSLNNFQGRYVILHEWEGEIACADPSRGRWGGPPGAEAPVWGAPSRLLRADGAGGAQNAPERPADAPEITSVGIFVKADIPEIGITAGTAEGRHARDPGPAGAELPQTPVEPPVSATAPMSPSAAGAVAEEGGCGSCATSGHARTNIAAPLMLVVGLSLLVARRRRARGAGGQRRPASRVALRPCPRVTSPRGRRWRTWCC